MNRNKNSVEVGNGGGRGGVGGNGFSDDDDDDDDVIEVVPCDDCGRFVPPADMEMHQLRDCPNRKLPASSSSPEGASAPFTSIDTTGAAAEQEVAEKSLGEERSSPKALAASDASLASTATPHRGRPPSPPRDAVKRALPACVSTSPKRQRTGTEGEQQPELVRTPPPAAPPTEVVQAQATRDERLGSGEAVERLGQLDVLADNKIEERACKVNDDYGAMHPFDEQRGVEPQSATVGCFNDGATGASRLSAPPGAADPSPRSVGTEQQQQHPQQPQQRRPPKRQRVDAGGGSSVETPGVVEARTGPGKESDTSNAEPAGRHDMRNRPSEHGGVSAFSEGDEEEEESYDAETGGDGNEDNASTTAIPSFRSTSPVASRDRVPSAEAAGGGSERRSSAADGSSMTSSTPTPSMHGVTGLGVGPAIPGRGPSNDTSSDAKHAMPVGPMEPSRVQAAIEVHASEKEELRTQLLASQKSYASLEDQNRVLGEVNRRPVEPVQPLREHMDAKMENDKRGTQARATDRGRGRTITALVFLAFLVPWFISRCRCEMRATSLIDDPADFYRFQSLPISSPKIGAASWRVGAPAAAAEAASRAAAARRERAWRLRSPTTGA